MKPAQIITKAVRRRANDAPGATASLTFTGTGFRWIGQMDSNYGRAWIYVDDVLVAIGNANSSTNPYQFTILELHGLENKQHTVRLEAESNAPVQVDAFAYYTGTDLDETVFSVALEPSRISFALETGNRSVRSRIGNQR